MKSSVFVGIYKYLVVFGFVIFRLPKHLVFFYLLILVFKVFEKIWIWYFILKEGMPTIMSVEDEIDNDGEIDFLGVDYFDDDKVDIVEDIDHID